MNFIRMWECCGALLAGGLVCFCNTFSAAGRTARLSVARGCRSAGYGHVSGNRRSGTVEPYDDHSQQHFVGIRCAQSHQRADQCGSAGGCVKHRQFDCARHQHRGAIQRDGRPQRRRCAPPPLSSSQQQCDIGYRCGQHRGERFNRHDDRDQRVHQSGQHIRQNAGKRAGDAGCKRKRRSGGGQRRNNAIRLRQ